MRHPVEIENIEEMRQREGIDDVELRDEIRSLQVGDCVKLTFQAGTKSMASETLAVRITAISGDQFRGKLAKEPAGLGLSTLRLGSAVRFTTAHIHSIAKKQPAREP
jgi:hypothetical protein